MKNQTFEKRTFQKVIEWKNERRSVVRRVAGFPTNKVVMKETDGSKFNRSIESSLLLIIHRYERYLKAHALTQLELNYELNQS